MATPRFANETRSNSNLTASQVDVGEMLGVIRGIIDTQQQQIKVLLADVMLTLKPIKTVRE